MAEGIQEKIGQYLRAIYTPETQEEIPPHSKGLSILYSRLQDKIQGRQGQAFLIIDKWDNHEVPYNRYDIPNDETMFQEKLGVLAPSGLEFDVQQGVINVKMENKVSAVRTGKTTPKRFSMDRLSSHISGWSMFNSDISLDLAALTFWDEIDPDLCSPEVKKLIELRDSSLAGFRGQYGYVTEKKTLSFLIGQEVEDYFWRGNKRKLDIPKELVPKESWINIADFSYLDVAKSLGISVSERFQRLYDEKIYRGKERIVGELIRLVSRESQLIERIEKVMGKIDKRPQKGGHIMFATRPEVPGMSNDDARIITLNDREELKEVCEDIQEKLKQALGFGMHEKPMVLNTEIPGQIIDVPRFISALAQKYEISLLQTPKTSKL